MFHIMVLLRAKDLNDIGYISRCLSEISAITLEEEPCCIRLDVYHSETDPKLFVLCEAWGKKEDWEAHREKRAFQQIYLPKVLPLVEREPHISQLISAAIEQPFMRSCL